MAIECIGCSLGHLSNARILLEEARKFERSDHELSDKHLVKALGEIRQGEEQHPDPKQREQVREIRKRIEASIAQKLPIPDVSGELEHKALRALNILRERPELCPTCKIGREIEHV